MGGSDDDMAFFGRVISYVMNELLVEKLANRWVGESKPGYGVGMQAQEPGSS